MVRPTKERRISYIPEIKFFKPSGTSTRELKKISLTLEEVEAIRLKDYQGLNQKEAAKKMEVSRPTYQRILTKAREKVAKALIDGKALKFEGGDYRFKPRCQKCGVDFSPGKKKRHRHGQQHCPRCQE